MSFDWEQASKDPKYQTGPKLTFFNAAGEVSTIEGEAVSTHALEYVDANENHNPRYPDQNGRLMIDFKFIDLDTKEEKIMSKAVGTVFFRAFIESKPRPGDKIIIHRTGSKVTTRYTVEKIPATEAPAQPQS